MSTKRRGKGLTKKNSVWYFKPSSIRKTNVLEMVNVFGKVWRFSGKSVISQAPTLHSKNFSKMELLSLASDLSTFDILGALDLFVCHRLISNILNGKTLDKKFDHIHRICTLRDPLVKVNSADRISNYHYLCLERDPQVLTSWRWYVRHRDYILNASLSHPYHLAGFSKK